MDVSQILTIVSALAAGLGGGAGGLHVYNKRKATQTKKARRKAGGAKAAGTRRAKAVEQVENTTDPQMYGRGGQ